MLIVIPAALAAPFEDVTAETLGSTAGWTNKVGIDDLDGDGHLDLWLANGGDYASPGDPEANGIWRGDGAGGFTALTLPGGPDLARAMAVGDVDGDGRPDLVVGTTYQTASRLFLGGPDGFTEASERLPRTLHSVGDVELGDLDGDGDLDLVLADWGPGNPLGNAGGLTRLWANEGGAFVDVTDARMPALPVGFSWDLALADVDSDLDLDLLVASKTGVGSALLRNDGSGTFTDASADLPQFTNNYVMAPMDVDDDGDLDLVTVNDGANLREHLLLNDGTGRFENANGTSWPASENVGEDDNAVVFVDLDDDGDPDFLIGSLSGADRALINDGGTFRLADGPLLDGGPTPGTLGLAVGDLDGDGRPDLLMGQGEAAFADKLYLGVDVAPDTHGPVVVTWQRDADVVRARIHDRATPVRGADLDVRWVAAGSDTPLRHVGGDLWFADVPPDDGGPIELCATDRAGNPTCVEVRAPQDTDPPDGDGPDDRCGCQTPGPLPAAALLLVGLAVRRRRR